MFIEPLTKCAHPPSGGPCMYNKSNFPLPATAFGYVLNVAAGKTDMALLTEGGLGFA